jgi:hypothetical protein
MCRRVGILGEQSGSLIVSLLWIHLCRIKVRERWSNYVYKAQGPRTHERLWNRLHAVLLTLFLLSEINGDWASSQNTALTWIEWEPSYLLTICVYKLILEERLDMTPQHSSFSETEFLPLRRTRIDSKESTPPACVTWRAGTTTLSTRFLAPIDYLKIPAQDHFNVAY